MEYYRATTAFSKMERQQQAQSSAVATSFGGGHAPMDGGAIGKGKGKHKGKGKGKYKGKGKGCNNYGYNGYGFNKGKGKQQGKGYTHAKGGKGYGSHGNDTNKGKSEGIKRAKGKDATNMCYKCGRYGHYARDCRVAIFNLGADDQAGQASQYNATQQWYQDGQQTYDQQWWTNDISQQQQMALPPPPATPQSGTTIHMIAGMEDKNIERASNGGKQTTQTTINATTNRDYFNLMIDSGAATHVCPRHFALQSPLYPLAPGQGPQLRTVTSEQIHVYGYKWIYIHGEQQQTSNRHTVLCV